MKYAYTEIIKKENGMYACFVNESAKPIYKEVGYSKEEYKPVLEWMNKHKEVKFFSAEQEILIETYIRSVSVSDYIDQALLSGVETDCVVIVDGKAHFKIPVYQESINTVKPIAFMQTFIRVSSDKKLECVCNENDLDYKNYDDWISKSTIIKFSDEEEEHSVFRYTINEFRKRDNALSMSTMLCLGIKTDCIAIENSVARFKKPSN